MWEGKRMIDQDNDDIRQLKKEIIDLESQGFSVPESIKSDMEMFVSEGGWLTFCESCKKFIVFPPEYAEGQTGIWGGNYHDEFYLCDECENGKPGHEAYHSHIEDDRRKGHQYQFVSRACSERVGFCHESVDKIARKNHMVCPWSARGVRCDHVSKIERDDELTHETKPMFEE